MFQLSLIGEKNVVIAKAKISPETSTN